MSFFELESLKDEINLNKVINESGHEVVEISKILEKALSVSNSGIENSLV